MPAHEATRSSPRPDALPAESPADQVTTNDYDANGNVLRTTAANPLGSGDQVTEFVHDETNRVVEQRVLLAEGDPLRTRLFYDRSDRVVMTVDAAGRVTQTQYNAQGKPEVQIARLDGEPLPFGGTGVRQYTLDLDALADDDLVTRFEYDHRQLPVARRTRSLDYSADPPVPADILEEYRYDALGRLTATISNSDGDAADGDEELIRRAAHDANGNLRLERVRRMVGEVFAEVGTVHEYDPFNQVVRTLHPVVLDADSGAKARAVETWEYDPAGSLVRATDARGTLTDLFYDGRGQLRRQTGNSNGTYAVTADDEIVSTFEYDLAGNRTAATLRREIVFEPLTTFTEFTTLTVYDGFSRPVRVTDPENHETVTAYDNAGNVVAFTDGRGHTTEFGYDRANRRTSATQPEVELHDGTRARPVSTTAYNGVGQPVLETDPLGNPTKYRYDHAGRLVQTIDALGSAVTTVYDPAGNVRAVSDAMGNVTTYAYNGLNQRTRAADPAGNTTTFRYDPAGSILAVVDPMQGETVFAYDPMGRKTSETLPENDEPRTYLYSIAGDLRVATDENGVATTATHDALGRTLSQRVGDGNPTLYAYDAAGNTVRVTDPEGRVAETFHDGLNRPSLVVEPLGRTTSYGYDGNGNRESILALNGFDAANGTQFETVFVYDELNRLAEHVFPDATPGVPTDNDRYVYGYDAAGRRDSAALASGRTESFALDAQGRPLARFMVGNGMQPQVVTATHRRSTCALLNLRT